MLVLSRHENESVVVGEGPNATIVTVVDIRGDKVRLGFEAPRSTPVHRMEVYCSIHGDRPRKPKAPAQQAAPARQAAPAIRGS